MENDMNMLLKSAALTVTTLSLAACTTTQNVERNALGGAAAGAAIGAGVGAVAGALIDKAERDPCDQFRQPQQQSFADYQSYYAAYNQWLNNYYAAYYQQYNAYAQAVANAQAGATTTVTVTGGCGCHQPEYVTEEVIVRQPVKRIKRAAPTKNKRLRRSKLRPAKR
jgi:hypothetical protein